jgi:hypothetical protein
MCNGSQMLEAARVMTKITLRETADERSIFMICGVHAGNLLKAIRRLFLLYSDTRNKFED